MNKTRTALFSTAVILTVMLAMALQQMPEEAPRIKTVRAGCEDVYNSVTVSGQLESNRTQRIAAAQFAQVRAVYAQPGDRVASGAQLFEIAYETPAVTEDGVVAALHEFVSGEAANFYTQAGETGETVCAAQDGMVLEMPAVGQQLYPGVVCARVADLGALQLRAKVPEMYAAGLAVGQKANFTLSAAPEKTYSAEMVTIAPYAARTSSVLGTDNGPTIEAVLAVRSASETLRPGYSASIKIFTDRREDAVTVPYEAVMQEGEEEVVYRVQDGALARTPVVTGYALSGGIEIRSGLCEGETLALPGAVTLADGLRVQIEDGV